MKLSKREIILLCLLIIMSLVYLFYTFAYKPVEEEKKRLSKENAVLKSVIEEGRAARVNKEKAEKEKIAMIKLGEDIGREIPSASYIPETIAFLNKTARESGVSLIEVNYSAVNQTKNGIINSDAEQKAGKDNENLEKVQVLEFTVSARGTYSSLLAFLLKIENAPRLYTINNCQMTAAKIKLAELPPDELEPFNTEDQQMVPNPPSVSINPTGSMAYEGNNILLNLAFCAYYDEESLLWIKETEDEVQFGEGKLNPFKI